MQYLVVAAAIFSWLIAFNVVNTRNQFVGAVAEFLYRITEPVLGPIRRRLPDLGGLDISPIILFFALMLIQLYLADYVTNTIRRIDINSGTTYVVTTYAGVATAGHVDGGSNTAQFNSPTDVAVANGTVFVADGTNRIDRFGIPLDELSDAWRGTLRAAFGN